MKTNKTAHHSLLITGTLLTITGTIILLNHYYETQNTENDTDAQFIQIRYETSNDLVNELDGIKKGHTYNVQANDGTTKPIKIALIDRGKQRLGIINTQETKTTNIGTGNNARIYTQNSTAYITIQWFKQHQQP